MANGNKLSSWTPVINSIKTPLGFFTLIALILDGVMLATASVTSKFPIWYPCALLAILVGCVFIIIMFKPLALYHPEDWPNTISISLGFPVEAIDVDLDVEKCRIEFRDKTGQKKKGRIPNLIFGPGGWTFNLSESIEQSDSLRLDLVEQNGRNWRVNPFTPYHTAVKCIMLHTPTN